MRFSTIVIAIFGVFLVILLVGYGQLTSRPAPPPDADLPVRWDTARDGRKYTVTEDTWLVFAKVPRKCIALSPTDGLKDREVRNEYHLRSLSGTRVITVHLIDPGETFGGFTCGE